MRKLTHYILLLIAISQLTWADDAIPFAQSQHYGSALIRVYIALFVLLAIAICILLYLKRKKGFNRFKHTAKQSDITLNAQRKLSAKTTLYHITIDNHSFLVAEHAQMLTIQALNEHQGVKS
ncbi:hypothetical protein [Cysteiniphilum litorale]|uniref:hypothetical protein n=1 Tax=Cysteiniphilum litorale TaxID=2056700 RepID=UPI003F885050